MVHYDEDVFYPLGHGLYSFKMTDDWTRLTWRAFWERYVINEEEVLP